MTTAWLGAGVSYRQRYHRGLMQEELTQAPQVLEVLPEHFFANPALLEPISSRYPLVFHEIGLSPGTVPSPTSEKLEKLHLRRLRRLCEHAKPILLTEHLALTRAPNGLALGHLAPLWYSHDQLSVVCQKVLSWQESLGLPIALENIAAPFVIPHAPMTEAQFLTELVERSGCGLLMDLTNLLYNARNFGHDPHELLQTYPLEAVEVVHLAGGFSQHRWWVDSHSRPVEPEAFALLPGLFPRARDSLRAIFVERDGDFPPLAELCAEAQHAAQICSQALTPELGHATQEPLHNNPKP